MVRTGVDGAVTSSELRASSPTDGGGRMDSTGTFSWYDLRTTDPDAAEAFYAAVVGWRVERAGDRRTFFRGAQPVATLSALPERARARGAPAHWLGHLAVAEIEAATRCLASRGGELLAPVAAEGGVAIVRDPQGAVLGLHQAAPGVARRAPLHDRAAIEGGLQTRGAIAWHELHTTDIDLAWATYAELAGWRSISSVDLGPPIGVYRTFAWPGSDRSVGGMANSARSPGIHTHWLFYFATDDLDASIASVRAGGGLVADGPRRVRGDDLIAVAEDPQGAAFGLVQPGGG